MFLFQAIIIYTKIHDSKLINIKAHSILKGTALSIITGQGKWDNYNNYL